MSAPTVAHTLSWVSSHTGTLPADVVAGDVLILNVTANGTAISSLSISGWTVLSPVGLGKPAGWGATTSFPGVVAYRDADGTEGGTTISLAINGGSTFNDVAVTGLVVRGSNSAIPVLFDDSGYPWYESTTGTTGHTTVPATTVPANTLQLITANGQQQGGTSPVYTYGGGFTREVETNRWFPACGWGSQAFTSAGAGSSCAVVQTNTGGADPDPYCLLVNITVKPGGWHIGGIRIH